MNTSYHYKNKTIQIIIPDQPADLPIVYVHLPSAASQDLYHTCKQHDFILVTIEGNDWNKDFSLWPSPRVFKQGEDFSGEAHIYLKELCEGLIPDLEERFDLHPHQRILAGYSLSGLFAYYALLHTDLFTGALCASASFWYPDFIDYALSHPFASSLQALYFSLGDKEKHARGLMGQVEENTQKLFEHVQEQNIETCFVLNAGGHFQEATERIAKGIDWLLTKKGATQ